MFGQKPKNGKYAMLEMDGLLREMVSKRKRIKLAVKNARADAAEMKEAYREANAITRPKS